MGERKTQGIRIGIHRKPKREEKENQSGGEKK